MMLLPPAEGTCPICGVEHPPENPHDAQSLYYQYRFYGVRGRWPTWADAIAHCSEELQRLWRSALEQRGFWTSPAEGDPIADPPSESVHQPIGDMNAPGFGPEFDPSINGAQQAPYLERCEFDDQCDYCKNPSGGSWAQLIHNPMDVTETDFYICTSCASARGWLPSEGR